MIQKTFNATLDTKRGVMDTPIVVVRGDTGNVFALKLQDNGTDLDLTNANIIVAFRGAGGSYTQDMETGGVTVSGATVTFPVYKDAVSEGTNSCDVQIYTEDDEGEPVLVTTAAFTFECRAATVGDDTVRADPSLPILLELIQRMAELSDEFPSITVSSITGGHRITITNYNGSVYTCDVMDGVSGVYVGSGDMPANCNVQIDPTGTASEFIPEPEEEGTNGQVLTTDGAGGRTWTTVQGGGGTSDYNSLTNKPSVNSVTLSGNKSLADIGAAAASHTHTEADVTGLVSDLAGKAASVHTHTKSEVTDFPTAVSAFTNDAGYLTEHQDISGKVNEPASEGTAGQVLTTDGNGGRSWATAGGSFTTLLWENPDTTQSVGEHTVSVDLSGYTFAVITFRLSTTTFGRKTDIIRVGDISVCFTKSASASTLYSRQASATETGVVFGTGYSGTTVATDRMIPETIYGIR